MFGTPDPNTSAGSFLQSLRDSQYLYNFIKFVEISSGLLLVSGIFVPLANLVVFPILVNILLFHLFLAPEGLPVALLIVASSAYIFWYYRRMFMFLVRYNAKIDPNSMRTGEVRPFGKHA